MSEPFGLEETLFILRGMEEDSGLLPGMLELREEPPRAGSEDRMGWLRLGLKTMESGEVTMWLRFADGPAMAEILSAERDPLFLRVCHWRLAANHPGVWRPLDLIGAEPDTDERVHVYYRTSKAGASPAFYRHISPQPDDATVRSAAAWQAWCQEQARQGKVWQDWCQSPKEKAT